MNTAEHIVNLFEKSIELKRKSIVLAPVIAQAAARLTASLVGGNKILICGNGGSAADAQHMAAELVNRFESERPGRTGLCTTGRSDRPHRRHSGRNHDLGGVGQPACRGGNRAGPRHCSRRANRARWWCNWAALWRGGLRNSCSGAQHRPDPGGSPACRACFVRVNRCCVRSRSPDYLTTLRCERLLSEVRVASSGGDGLSGSGSPFSSAPNNIPSPDSLE